MLLVDNSLSEYVQTRAETVGDLLAERQITLEDGDIVSPSLLTRLEFESSLQVEIKRARSVTLTVNGQARIYRTHLTNPADILTSAGLSVGEHDRLYVDGSEASLETLAAWPVPASAITLKRAMTLTVHDGSAQQVINTTSETVGEALFEAGITLYLADSLTPDTNTPVSDGLNVYISRSRPVSILADGVIVETRARGGTVADALAEAGIALVGLDYAVPDDETPLLPGMRIRVIRVTEDVLIEEEVQPYETIYQADAAMELDQTAVLQAGQSGVVQHTVRIRYENGIEISRVVEETTPVQEVVDEVIAYGTNVVLRTVETPEGPRQYWRRLRMYATSYHPAALGGDNITATGRVLTKGIVGSNPDVIPYDTQVYVPGYGVGIMADTGALTRRLRIDLGYDDANFVPWSRWVDVYLLAPVPENIAYLLPQ